jgi:hypothetical protein
MLSASQVRHNKERVYIERGSPIVEVNLRLPTVMILHFKRLAAVIFVLVGTVSSTGATSEGPRCSCKSEGQVNFARPSSRATESERQQYLDAHNTVRGRYGAEDLVWDNAAATAAQVWADNCRFAHEDDSLYGGQGLGQSSPTKAS